MVDGMVDRPPPIMTPMIATAIAAAASPPEKYQRFRLRWDPIQTGEDELGHRQGQDYRPDRQQQLESECPDPHQGFMLG